MSYDNVREMIKCCTRVRTLYYYEDWLAFARQAHTYFGRGAVIQVFTSISGVGRGCLEYQYVPQEFMIQMAADGTGEHEMFRTYDPSKEFVLGTFYVQHFKDGRTGSGPVMREMEAIGRVIAPVATSPFAKVVSRVSIGNVVLLTPAFREIAMAAVKGTVEIPQRMVPDINALHAARHDWKHWNTGSGTGCDGCGACDEHKLLVCARCKDARYCSRECQKRDWKLHKLDCDTCKAMREDAEKFFSTTF